MHRFNISAKNTFLLLTVSCLASFAYGRDLLGTKIYDKLSAFSHNQEPTDREAELESKYESLMQAVLDLQAELEHEKKLRSSSVNRDVIDRAFME